jgi:hypothetical protein
MERVRRDVAGSREGDRHTNREGHQQAASRAPLDASTAGIEPNSAAAAISDTASPAFADAAPTGDATTPTLAAFTDAATRTAAAANTTASAPKRWMPCFLPGLLHPAATAG